MDVVNTIQNAPTTGAGPFASDVPKKPIFILKATLENTHDKPSR
jgi:peptidyl-prolyl cis-trans isomerase A (cyclophilin A)